MSLKSIFSSAPKIAASQSLDSAGSEVESAEYVVEKQVDISRYVPPVDYSDPTKFAKFGLASKYYNDAFVRISNQYPYDGSLKEKTQFFNTSSNFDKWIYDNKYPRFTGYVNFSPSGWGSSSATQSGYGLPVNLNYIYIKGGPNTSGTTLVDKFKSSNFYSEEYKRSSNLYYDLSGSGVTVEFWLNKSGFDSSKTEKEVIFDLWNNQAASNTGYGRLTIELTSSTSDTSAFYLTAQSGTSGFFRHKLSSLTVSELTSSSWNQYSVVLANNGAGINTKFYINGQLNNEFNTGTAIQPVTGAMLATIGSLITAVSGTSTALGYGKLSGSLDEFRFWKTDRTEKDIKLNWFTNVNGGSNTDDANTDLGVYYKFNEGIVGDSTYDAVVLDYSGRISNGTFVGYETSSRSTGSAFILSNLTEQADPTINIYHPDYSSSLNTLVDESFDHDSKNNAAVYNYLPQWIREDEELNGEGLLPNLVQTISVYFDNLSHQIDQVNKLKNIEYTSGSDKPIPFANRLIENYGLTVPELFVESEITEFFTNRTDTLLYSSSLSEVKNKIYLNIYNNLSNILKSKGTEKSYRNLIRCFGVDSELIKMNLYADGVTYPLKDNTYSTVAKRKFVDFNDTDRFDTTVYQYADPSIDSSLSYIPGNASGSYMGFTAETEVIFPKKSVKGDSFYQPYLHLTSSLFGLHEANSSSASDYTWNGTDSINFQVYAVRPEEESKNAYFLLRDYNGTYVNISSSIYTDVYSNSKWNFAVRVRPDYYENISLVSGTTSSTYTIEFYGVKTSLDIVESEFLVTQSLSNSTGKDFFTKAKRFYVGSHVLNFTSSQNVLTRTDTKISTLKYWQSYLDNDVIIAHSKDTSNYGALHPYKNAYFPITEISGVYVPQIETLALNWDFTTVTSSDAGDGNPTNKVAQFIVQDASSGSLSSLNKYEWLGNILNHQYTGRGDFFLPNETQVVNTEYVFTARQQLPESLDSLDSIRILSQDDLAYTRDTKPANYYYTFEKSMYQSISEEMLNMFGTIIEFNNLIGEPVHRYRQEYKELSKLRQLFFEKVQNVPDFDKFVDFYKWLDSAISVFIGQLTPASANVSEKIFNLVENHILSRNKYWNKFPTIEFKGTDPESGAESINKLLYNWKFGYRPLDGLQSTNADYWLNRAERNTSLLASSDAGVNYSRGMIFSASVSALTRKYSTPVRYVVDESAQIKSGVNFNKNKKIDFLKIATAPHGPNITDAIINIPANVLFVGVEDTSSLLKNVTDIKNPNAKVKYSFTTIQGRDYESTSLGYGEILKSDIAVPANFISGNITTGYNADVANNFMSGVIITNLHNDAYGDSKEIPIQGPFTNQWVGGLQSRHVSLNAGSDDYTSRPEAWMLLLGQIGTSSYQATMGFVGADYPYPEGNPDSPSYPVRSHRRAYYFREETAKRPVNIRNIQYSTSSANIGNFRTNYEVVYSNGRTNNDMLLTDQTTVVNTAQTELKEVVRTTATTTSRTDFALPTRTAYKTVIGNRFSAPGEIRTLSRGYLNRYAEEMSAYNALPFRNKQIIGDANRVSDTLSVENPTTEIVPSIISGTNGTNFNSLMIKHTEYGGYMSGSSVIPSIHKANKNTIYRYDDSGVRQVFDNGFITHQIPRKDSGYAWISASLTQGITTNNPANFGFVDDFVTVPSGTTSTYASLPIVSTSDVGLDASGAFVLTGAVVTADSVGLNTILIEQISVDTLGDVTSSLTSLTSSIVSSVANSAGLFNALMITRNGLYQYPSFKQVFRGSHPVVRYQTNSNQIGTAKNLPQLQVSLNQSVSLVGRKQNVFFTEPPVVYRKPITTSLGYNDGKLLSNVQITFSNQNETEYFCSDELNYLLGLSKCERESYLQVTKLYLNGALQSTLSPINKFNGLRYEENVYPSAINKFRTIVRRRTNFDNQFWRDSQTDRISNNLSQSYGLVTIPSQSMWSLDAPSVFTSRTITDAGVLSSGNGAGILQNNNSFYYSSTGSAQYLKISPLYSRKHMVQSTASYVAKTGLNIPAVTSSIPIGFGEASWTAARDSVYVNILGNTVSSSQNPFYDSYDEYSDDISYIGKNASLVPEFRVENKIEDYLSTKDVSVLNDLSIIGGDTSYSDNTSNTFYKTYTNTEFMKNFAVVKEEHKDLVDPTKITLECNAFVKFMPYKGFYPADRTVDIATAFSSSYLPYVSSSLASSSYISSSIFSDDIKHRNFITPFLAPGILYNTIKSGVAVDYAILEKPVLDAETSGGININSQNSYKALDIRNPNGSGSNVMIAARNDSDAYISKRLPFEALLKPDTYVKNTVLYDFESHPSASTNLRLNNFSVLSGSGEDGVSTSILRSGADNKYKYMVNNFLSEVVDFFLADGQLTSLTSKPENTLNLSLTSGSVYGARLKMYRSLNEVRRFYPSKYDLPQDPDSNYDFAARKSITDGVSSSYTGSLLSSFVSNSKIAETFTMYSRPTAFGPDFAASNDSSSIDYRVGNITSSYYARDARTGFNPIYTPPYYYGESWADIIFKATETKQYSIQEIIQNSNINYLRFDTHQIDWSYTFDDAATASSTIRPWAPHENDSSSYYLLSQNRVNSNAMQLSASLNIQNYKTVINSDVDSITKNITLKTSDTSYAWNIETKFETPMLNFAGLNLDADDLPSVARETVPRGIWHQFGRIPDDDQGVFVQITDIPTNWLRFNPLATGSAYYNASTQIKDLTQLVGFSNEPVKLGKLQKTKKVYEAVVAVPFIEEAGVKKFFEIPADTISVALGTKQANTDGSDDAGDTIKQLSGYLDKYIFPPMFDFKKNETATPVSMYVFEFDYDLGENDLSYIWQNLPPISSRIVEKKTATISHKLFYNELMGHANALKNQTIDSQIQWMVFKVKQRAKVDYSEYLSNKVVDTSNKIIKTDGSLGVLSNKDENLFADVKYSYNWPYDFFSLVELTDVKATIDFEPLDDNSSKKVFTNEKLISTTGNALADSNLSSVPTSKGLK